MKGLDKKKFNIEVFRVWLIRGIWCLLGITLAGIILGGVLFFSITQVSGWNTFIGQDGQTEVYSKDQIDKFITNVLVVVQNQPLSEENAPADMVFIVSFNAFEQRLTVVALASQTLVDVDGYGEKRLAEAYALGGPGLLVNTINQSFDLDLQKYVCTDTHTLATMIDLLGGIKIELAPSELRYLDEALGENSEGLTVGSTTLNGVQSMVHAMDNISGHDPLGSQYRSLTLIKSAVLNMRKTATRKAMLPLLSLVFSSVNTNLDIGTLNDLGYEILKADDIEHYDAILPFKDTWKVAGEDEADIQADLARNRELLHQMLFNAG